MRGYLASAVPPASGFFFLPWYREFMYPSVWQKDKCLGLG